MIEIKARKISQQNFHQYGKLVHLPESVPTAQSVNFKFWSDLAHYHIDGNTEIGICSVYRQPKPIVAGMERHVDTPEILIPIDAPFLVPLLRNQEASEKAAVFQVDIGEAIVIDPGIWHGACLPVGKTESSYFVIFKHGTPHKDVEKKTIQSFVIPE